MDQQVDKKLPNEARMMIQAELRVLLNNQKELLNKLVFDYTTFLKTLGDFDFSRQQMLTHANKFAIYLDENLLWVKSSDPINWDTLGIFFYRKCFVCDYRHTFSQYNILCFYIKFVYRNWHSIFIFIF